MDEPLKVEEIIASCYNNPDRKKHPDFTNKSYSGWDGPVSLYSGDKDTLEHFKLILQNEVPSAA